MSKLTYFETQYRLFIKNSKKCNPHPGLKRIKRKKGMDVTVYFNNIKRRITISTGFTEFESAQRTLSGIEVVNIIRKNQIEDSKSSTFKTFKPLAA